MILDELKDKENLAQEVYAHIEKLNNNLVNLE